MPTPMSTKAPVPTKAAEDFIKAKGLEFDNWYAPLDVQRILWKKYNTLADNVKKDTVLPYVLMDRAREMPLVEVLPPFIEYFKKTPQKYYPFIFKPEVGASHYIAGFLRKNNDQEVSVFIFNPTGTAIRTPWYGLELKKDLSEVPEEELVAGTLYLKIRNKALQYTVRKSKTDLEVHSLSENDLKTLGIKIDLNKPLTEEIIKDDIRPKIDKLLEMTCSRGHTVKKIEIINSSAKIQTIERDKGVLRSCGPLCLAFIDHVIKNPEYMEKLDKTFILPDFLKALEIGTVKYKDFVLGLRKQHADVLDTIADSVLKVADRAVAEINTALIAYAERNDVEKDIDVGTEDDWGVAGEAEDDWGNDPVVTEDEPVAHAAQPSPHIELLQPAASVIRSAPPAAPAPIQLPPKATEDPEKRVDVKFIRSQIARFRENAKSCFSINNEMKAKKIEEALELALVEIKKNPALDARENENIIEALAIHRIFGFFGCKLTTATADLKKSMDSEPLVKDSKP